MLCVIAKIDAAARERLSTLQHLAEKSGIAVRNLYGHITLATYVGNEEEKFVSSCKAILSGCSVFTVRYDKIEVLSDTSIIVASPAMTDEITDIQRKIAKVWEEYLDEWTRKNKWYPHTTLVYDSRADLASIAEIMQSKFAPFDAQIGRIEFSRVKEKGYEIVDFIELQ